MALKVKSQPRPTKGKALGLNYFLFGVLSLLSTVSFLYYFRFFSCGIDKNNVIYDEYKNASNTVIYDEYSTNNNTNNERNKKSFKELVIASRSDKYHRHHFENYYETWLQPYRSKPGLKFLEIGARDGKSLKLWDQYFFDKTKVNSIIGLGYDSGGNTKGVAEKAATMEKVRVVFGDQSKTETMNQLISLGPHDVIIDDGSHVPQHVIFTLFSLWDKAVKPGGLYIIEDIETSYWPHGKEIYGYHMNHTGIGASAEFSVVTKLQQLQNVMVRYQIGASELSVMPGDHDICSMDWGMNIVAIRKCPNPNSFPAIEKPPLQKKVYNEDEMNQWIQTAKKSNPNLEQN